MNNVWIRDKNILYFFWLDFIFFLCLKVECAHLFQYQKGFSWISKRSVIINNLVPHFITPIFF